MARQHTNDLYPPVEIPKRHMPWFIQILVLFAVIVLAAVVYAFWDMGRMPARTLEVPPLDQPSIPQPEQPGQERPQPDTPVPPPAMP